MSIFHGLFAIKFSDRRGTIAMQGGRKRFAETLLCDIQ